jgi:hypothetical protein
MQDLSVLADEDGHRIMGACPPEQTTTLQLIRSFIRYARAHRSELPGNAAVVVFRALRGAYPCRAEHGDSIPAPARLKRVGREMRMLVENSDDHSDRREPAEDYAMRAWLRIGRSFD